jgi:hypothetical protein
VRIHTDVYGREYVGYHDQLMPHDRPYAGDADELSPNQVVGRMVYSALGLPAKVVGLAPPRKIDRMLPIEPTPVLKLELLHGPDEVSLNETCVVDGDPPELVATFGPKQPRQIVLGPTHVAILARDRLFLFDRVRRQTLEHPLGAAALDVVVAGNAFLLALDGSVMRVAVAGGRVAASPVERTGPIVAMTVDGEYLYVVTAGRLTRRRHADGVLTGASEDRGAVPAEVTKLVVQWPDAYLLTRRAVVPMRLEGGRSRPPLKPSRDFREMADLFLVSGVVGWCEGEARSDALCFALVDGEPKELARVAEPAFAPYAFGSPAGLWFVPGTASWEVPGIFLAGLDGSVKWDAAPRKRPHAVASDHREAYWLGSSIGWSKTDSGAALFRRPLPAPR